MKNTSTNQVLNPFLLIPLLSAFLFMNSVSGQSFNTHYNSDRGEIHFIDNDNSNTDEDAVWVFDRNNWTNGSNLETMRLSYDKLKLKGRFEATGDIRTNQDIYARGHMFLHAYEGLGQSGTAYIQARDLSSSGHISLQFRTQRAGNMVDAMMIDRWGFVGLGVTPNAPLHFQNGFNRKKIILEEIGVNNHQFHGFGINENLLVYQVGNTLSSHAFFAGNSTTASNELMRIKGNGYVGIGNNNPKARLHLGGGFERKKLVLYGDTNSEDQFAGFGVESGLLRYQISNTSESHVFYAATDGVTSNELMRIKGNGSVGIGVAADRFETGCKLNVNGATYIGDFGDGYNSGFVRDTLLDNYMLWVEKGIVTEDLAIGHVQSWSDYVFENDYELPTLQSLEKFIKANKHLPAIPSEMEVKEKGYSQHKLNNGFLKTIEELSLYAIEQDKQITALKEDVKNQQAIILSLEENTKQLESLRNEMENLKKMVTELSVKK